MKEILSSTVVDLLHVASRHGIVDDYRFTENGVYISEGSNEYLFRNEEAAMFLRGLLCWFVGVQTPATDTQHLETNAFQSI